MSARRPLRPPVWVTLGRQSRPTPQLGQEEEPAQLPRSSSGGRKEVLSDFVTCSSQRLSLRVLSLFLFFKTLEWIVNRDNIGMRLILGTKLLYL